MKKKEGILIWITGLSGSGKSTIGKMIKRDVEKNYGKTLLVNGDDLRKIFKINNYDKFSRFETGKKYIKFCKFLVKQKINVIFTVVGLFNELRKINRKEFKNYLEIYIKTNVRELIKSKRKKIYKTQTSNVWGIDIKPEFPKKAHIVIRNNHKRRLNDIKYELISKINKKLKINY